jgi:hypothetical protein
MLGNLVDREEEGKRYEQILIFLRLPFFMNKKGTLLADLLKIDVYTRYTFNIFNI